jgi:pimeloyl-ACP methyl ester carboxylesterase
LVKRVYTPFTPSHRGGSGPPLVCLHGFMDTWHTWELVLPALERRHDVLALTLAGHAGGPKLEGEPSAAALAEAVEREMDRAGVAVADLVGSSLGGYLALELAARGRARTVVAFAPAGGWAAGDRSWRTLLELQGGLHRQARTLAPGAHALLATAEGRRRATELLTVNYEHLPPELLAQQLLAVAACPAAPELIEFALRNEWRLDAEAVSCPVRIAWGTEDRLLPWPRAAARYREQWLPHADWVVLDGVGHYPQLDVPLEAAQLILGFTGA